MLAAPFLSRQQPSLNKENPGFSEILEKYLRVEAKFKEW